MNALRPDWLVRRPIAHRGLHDRKAGIIENSARAANAAISGNFAIECDVQISSDGLPMVFHDATLGRLTGEAGRVDERSASALSQIMLRSSADTISSLLEFLALVAGRTPLIVEIKSEFTGDMKLAEATARIVSQYAGPLALKSFDPWLMGHLRKHRTTFGIAHVPLGIVAEAHYDDEDWNFLTSAQKSVLVHFLHWQETRPDFLSWSVADLPSAVPNLLRHAVGIPVMTWTVRTPEQRERAAQWADQMIFEGWLPNT